MSERALEQGIACSNRLLAAFKMCSYTFCLTAGSVIISPSDKELASCLRRASVDSVLRSANASSRRTFLKFAPSSKRHGFPVNDSDPGDGDTVCVNQLHDDEWLSFAIPRRIRL